MIAPVFPAFRPILSPGATLTGDLHTRCRLEVPPGPQKAYRLAQLDDYASLKRDAFPWKPPLTFSLRARVSAASLPGTWGFGLWNDPFSLSLGMGGGVRKFPALPNAAWYFYASPPNYLSFADTLPADGFLAATFQSNHLPAVLLGLAAPAAALLLWRPAARLLRRQLRRFVHQSAMALRIDVTEWHSYAIEWQPQHVTFRVDGEVCAETGAAPRPPLGLVIWVDNQYAAFPPDGRLAYGTLPADQPAWIEFENARIHPEV